MSLLVVGANHGTCPLEQLERLAAGAGDGAALAVELTNELGIRESMVLATCNRVEVYVETEAFHAGVAAVQEQLMRRTGLPATELAGHMYAHHDGAAVEHLFHVVAGLDSMAVGEAEVLGQVRAAYDRARAAGTAGGLLAGVVEPALRVGRRVRAASGLEQVGSRMVAEALAQAWAHVGDLAQARVAVVGAGGLAALICAELARRGTHDLVVANRGHDRAARLAGRNGGVAVGLQQLPRLLRERDVVVLATGSIGPVVPAAELEQAWQERGGRPLALIDLALPRDVEAPEVLPDGLMLVDLERLGTTLDGSGPVAAAVVRAKGLVEEALAEWRAEAGSYHVAPTVVALRALADDVVRGELQRLAGRLAGQGTLTAAQQDAVHVEVERAVRRVVDKVLHAPTVRVRELASSPGGSAYAEALQTLFGLDVSQSLEPIGDVSPQGELT